MEIKEHEAVIEAILFASGEPVPAERIAEVIGVDLETTLLLIERLADNLIEDGRGVRIKRMDNRFQMCSDPEHGEQVRKALDMRKNVPLSQAALEILAIVAYNQPVTKAFVEQIRGVDCSGTISSLIVKGLVEEKGRLELPGRPLLYGTTAEFLRCLDIASLNGLPPLPSMAEQEEQVSIFTGEGRTAFTEEEA